jgi:hypothetical protein
MLIIMWNSHGFYVTDRLPTGSKISGTYYTTNVLQPLRYNFFLLGRDPHGKRLVVHVDNCLVYGNVTTELFMKTRDMVLMPRPPYSLGLAPSDFY